MHRYGYFTTFPLRFIDQNTSYKKEAVTWESCDRLRNTYDILLFDQILFLLWILACSRIIEDIDLFTDLLRTGHDISL